MSFIFKRIYKCERCNKVFTSHDSFDSNKKCPHDLTLYEHTCDDSTDTIVFVGIGKYVGYVKEI